jgi:hypothetical protein
MYVNRFVWIPLALTVAACGTTQHAATGPPTSALVSGTVLAGPIAPVAQPGVADTRPVSGALVEVLRDTTVSASTRTDSLGRYQISIPPGSYIIVVTAKGYLMGQQRKSVAVTAGQKLKINVTIDTGIR